ncbi:hypothetical protein BL253_23605 [Pseudofrankia asymbiotica]|uniref:Uncharacterized protein n=1 Tax=Pseudofrankia asymbiotica TaxID=1834516 RepID=A0A1V2I8H4_9ACTN|nr:hypothetical protein BL253_23605 [Pseudofrankia asymbiotica]
MAVGAGAAPELEARTGTWRIGLAALGLAAVVGGLAAAVVSASSEPRPPDLGGPILARGPVSTSAPAPSTSPSQMPAPTPAQIPGGLERRGPYRSSAATAVPVRPVPLPIDPTTDSPRAPRTAAPAPAPAPATESAPASEPAVRSAP